MSTSLAAVSVERVDDRVVVLITGEIDLSNADGIEREIEDAAFVADEVVIDLSPVEYIDSQGVRLLYRLSRRLTADAKRLVVVAPDDGIVGDVLRITQMSDLIEIRSSLE